MIRASGLVVTAKAGTYGQAARAAEAWIPTCVGMTIEKSYI
jgi:hypothetical protein